MPPERVKDGVKLKSPLSLHSQTALPEGEPLILLNFCIALFTIALKQYKRTEALASVLF